MNQTTDLDRARAIAVDPHPCVDQVFKKPITGGTLADAVKQDLYNLCCRLEPALRTADRLLTELFDADAVCDHGTGICWCDYRRDREAIRRVLDPANV